MSDTHVNAYRLELAEKRQQLATLRGEVDRLSALVLSLDESEKPAEEAAPATEEAETPETATSNPREPVKVDVKDGDAKPQVEAK